MSYQSQQSLLAMFASEALSDSMLLVGVRKDNQLV